MGNNPLNFTDPSGFDEKPQPQPKPTPDPTPDNHTTGGGGGNPGGVGGRFATCCSKPTVVQAVPFKGAPAQGGAGRASVPDGNKWNPYTPDGQKGESVFGTEVPPQARGVAGPLIAGVICGALGGCGAANAPSISDIPEDSLKSSEIALNLAVFYAAPRLLGNLGGKIFATEIRSMRVSVTMASVAERVATIPKLVVRTGAGTGEHVLEATVVRVVTRGERWKDVVAEVEALTRASGNEHAIASLANGSRAILSGGADGISFDKLDVARLLLHSHLEDSLPGLSSSDSAYMHYLSQRSSWLLELRGNGLPANLSRIRVIAQ